MITTQGRKTARSAARASGRSAYVRPAARRPAYRWVRPASRRRARRRLRRARILAAALALIAILLIWRVASRPDSVQVLPGREMPCVPVCFYQEDAAWSGERMGGSERTLGKDGDTIACLASMLAMRGLSPLEGELNPGTLNAWLSANGAYDRGGDLDWGRTGRLLGLKAGRKRAWENPGELLDRLVSQERCAIVRVRRPDTGRMHEVLVVGSVHGEYTIMDPLDPTDTLNTLGLYQNRIYEMKYLE